MIPRKRYGTKNTDQGVYLGLSKTQVLSPATAGSRSSDLAPPPPPVALVPPPPDTMSCRDRTQEFLSACKFLQSRQVRAGRGRERQRRGRSLSLMGDWPGLEGAVGCVKRWARYLQPDIQTSSCQGPTWRGGLRVLKEYQGGGEGARYIGFGEGTGPRKSL